nr:DegT/DnrJ/EryC1/StrS family aminotransferase [Desulfonatronospira thiodismutans]
MFIIFRYTLSPTTGAWGMGHGAKTRERDTEGRTPTAKRQALYDRTGMFPEAEKYYQEALTLPLFPAMSEADQDRVVEAIKRILPTEHSEGH